MYIRNKSPTSFTSLPVSSYRRYELCLILDLLKMPFIVNARADLAPFVAKIERKSNNNIVLFRLQIKNKDNAIRTCLLHFVQMKYA